MELTARQESLLKFLLEYIQVNGYQPSRQEFADHFGISKSAINQTLLSLEKKGWIKLDPHRERAIRIMMVRFQAILAEVSLN
jgi:SOS-response transcriptional repressor LexA